MTNSKRSKRSISLLIGLTIGWVVLFSYLLLTSDPPDVGPVRLRSFEGSGHLFGSLLLSLLVFLVINSWTGRPGRAALLSLGTTLSFLVGMEFVQELRPGRGYERIDIELNLLGTTAGVALAWATVFLRARLRDRRHATSDPETKRSQ